MGDYTEILYEKRGAAGLITLNRPQVMNAISPTVQDEMSTALDDAVADPEVRAIIITGAGRAFSAGMDQGPKPGRRRDLEWPYGVPTGQSASDWIDSWRGREGNHFLRLWELDKPVIGAINGWAAGAGFYLMLTSTDIRLASAEHARFKFALLSQGWVGNGPGATFLTRQIAYADAMRILLTDEPFDAQEALRINLINEVVAHDRLMDRAQEIARHVAALPPVAVRMMKEFAIRFRDVPVTEAWRVQTLMNTLLTQLTTDGDEGRQAFLEKRPPQFTGGLRQKGEPYPDVDAEQRARLDEVRRELLG